MSCADNPPRCDGEHAQLLGGASNRAHRIDPESMKQVKVV